MKLATVNFQLTLLKCQSAHLFSGHNRSWKWFFLFHPRLYHTNTRHRFYLRALHSYLSFSTLFLFTFSLKRILFFKAVKVVDVIAKPNAPLCCWHYILEFDFEEYTSGLDSGKNWCIKIESITVSASIQLNSAWKELKYFLPTDIASTSPEHCPGFILSVLPPKDDLFFVLLNCNYLAINHQTIRALTFHFLNPPFIINFFS